MTMSNRSLVTGVFQDRAMAEEAIAALKAAGFSHEQIMHAGKSGGAFAGLKRLFGGDDTANNTISLRQDMLDMGFSASQVSYYEKEHAAGNTIVLVTAQGREQEARRILQSRGGYDEMGRNAAMGTGTTTASTINNAGMKERASTTNEMSMKDRAASDMSKTGMRNRNVDTNLNEDEQARTIRLREEQLQATKERVQAGEVTLHKDIISEQQTINVPVTHEEVFIEQHPVQGGRVDNTPLGEGETIRVPVSEEQVQVDKETIVTGEVSIGKRQVQENQRVTDTVRHEELRVEREGNAPLRDAKQTPPDNRRDKRRDDDLA